jgi:hypothetical protein
MRMPGAARPAAVVGAASPATASLNVTQSISSGVRSGMPAARGGRSATGQAAGIWALGCDDDGR